MIKTMVLKPGTLCIIQSRNPNPIPDRLLDQVKDALTERLHPMGVSVVVLPNEWDMTFFEGEK